MGDKAKNIISNILGLIVSTGAFVGYFLSKIGVSQFGILLTAGLILFLFKASKTREWLNKFLNKKLNK